MIPPRHGKVFKRVVLALGAFALITWLSVLGARALLTALNVTEEAPRRIVFQPTAPAQPGPDPEHPDFAPVAGRAGEDGTSLRLRQRLVDTFVAYVEAAHLTHEQASTLRRTLLEAQINCALWKRYFVKQAIMDDLVAHAPTQAGESYMDQMVTALGMFISASAKHGLSEPQRTLLEQPVYDLLRNGTGILARPFDVDEITAAGLVEPPDRAALRAAIVQRLQRHLPDAADGNAATRRQLAKRLRLD